MPPLSVPSRYEKGRGQYKFIAYNRAATEIDKKEVKQMKHGNSFYLELTRELFTEEYKTLSNGAKWLFVVLNELEQRYTGKGCDYFFRTDKELAEDANMPLRSMKRAKAELKKTVLVEMWNGHLKYEDGKRSEFPVSYYRILK